MLTLLTDCVVAWAGSSPVVLRRVGVQTNADGTQWRRAGGLKRASKERAAHHRLATIGSQDRRRPSSWPSCAAIVSLTCCYVSSGVAW